MKALNWDPPYKSFAFQVVRLQFFSRRGYKLKPEMLTFSIHSQLMVGFGIVYYQINWLGRCTNNKINSKQKQNTHKRNQRNSRKEDNKIKQDKTKQKKMHNQTNKNKK